MCLLTIFVAYNYKEEHFKEWAGFKMFSQYLCASTLANGVEVCRLIFMEFKCIQQKFIWK